VKVLAELVRRGDDKKLREALAELDAAIIGLGGSLGTCKCPHSSQSPMSSFQSIAHPNTYDG
jgi:hypothetical protein